MKVKSDWYLVCVNENYVSQFYDQFIIKKKVLETVAL